MFLAVLLTRLWRLLAEQALEALDFGIAEKAFVLCGMDAFHGVRLVKRLAAISDRLASGGLLSIVGNTWATSELSRRVQRDNRELFYYMYHMLTVCCL